MMTKNIIKNGIILIAVISIVIFAFQIKTLKLKYLIYKTKKEGYRLKEYFINAEDKNIYFLLLTESTREKEFSSDKLTVYKNSLFNIHKIGAIEDGEIKFHKLNFKDINDDRIKDIIVSTSSFGSCFCCDKIEIYNIKNDKFRKLNKFQFGCINDLIDLNNDNVYEIILFDDRFEFYDELCHACSPSVEYVYKWQGKEYIPASEEFPDFYNKKIENLITDIKSDYKNYVYLDSDRQGYYLGKIITLLLNYKVKGEKDEGIKFYKKYAKPEFFRDKIKPTAMKIFNNPEDFLNKYKLF